MSERRSGILLHVSSLPGRFGIGDLGSAAYRFADFLAEAGQQVWQVLPLMPVGEGFSPYASPSSFAGNPLLISPERLAADRLLDAPLLDALPDLPDEQVDWATVVPVKRSMLEHAFERFSEQDSALRADFERYMKRSAEWLDDYALFMALCEAHDGANWTEWPAPLRRRNKAALNRARKKYQDSIRHHAFTQFIFERQWAELRSYCHQRGIEIFGDLPIYVAHQSADVWANQDLFHLEDEGQPTVVSGVPPDYFSETGQLWGNPLYRWDVMAADGFSWWRRRFRRTLELVDFVRLDHFRGIEAYWQVPVYEETAVDGEWVEGPGDALLEALAEETESPLPLVAEDLGLITDEVRELMRRHDVPGMVVLQFGFADLKHSEHVPFRYQRHAVAYTGTHDNNTFRGWFEDDASRKDQEAARRLLALDHSSETPTRAAIRAVVSSSADLTIVPLQDVAELGSAARMNVPGTEDGNWSWRCRPSDLSETNARYLRDLCETYGRLTR